VGRQHVCVALPAEWQVATDISAGHVTVNSSGLAVRAAVDGLGIAYAIEAQAEPFVRSGQLVRALEDWSPSYEGYFLAIQGTARSRRRCARSST
jgi:DNA-binding transcriptional LysR family regulator